MNNDRKSCLNISWLSVILDIKGVEIGFEFEEKKSCVQIVPVGKSQSKQGKITTYRFKIKDPAFMTIKQEKYTFYFGRAYIKGLIECESRVTGERNQTKLNLCAAENTISKSIDIGILKIKDVDISYLRPGKILCFELVRLSSLMK